MTRWQVEQASEPAQAPSSGTPFLWATSSSEMPFGASTSFSSPEGMMKVMWVIGSLHVLAVLACERARDGGVHAAFGEAAAHSVELVALEIDAVAVRAGGGLAA